MAEKSWTDLSAGMRVLTVAAGALSVALLIATQVDITRRPAKRIRGPKGMWRAIAFINTLGPLAYFVRGRLRD